MCIGSSQIIERNIFKDCLKNNWTCAFLHHFNPEDCGNELIPDKREGDKVYYTEERYNLYLDLVNDNIKRDPNTKEWLYDEKYKTFENLNEFNVYKL